MKSNLQVFEYRDRRRIRTVEIDGEPWFYAIDVGLALEIQNTRDAVARLDIDDVGTTDGVNIRGRKQRFSIVNEPGLYQLVFESRKPEAKQFKRWITHEVLPQLRRTGVYQMRGASRVPIFVRRFNDNWDRTDPGYFSVISELFIRVYGRFERVGYVLPDKGDTGREMRPDTAVGKRFPRWLASNYPHLADKYAMYDHLFPDGLTHPARQYRREVLTAFIEFVDDVWLVEHAAEYFRERDRKALDYLPKLLPAPKRDAG